MEPSQDELRRAIAVLAHELRNPLSVFRAGVDLLPDDDSQEARVKSVLLKQTLHMTRLVEDLSDISRAELGKLRIERCPMDLQAIIEEVGESFGRTLAARCQKLALTVPDSAIWINGDSIRIGQMITNLLSNASKYSDPGSRIELSVAIEGERVRVRVRDFGIGIANDDLARIFDFLSQCDSQEALDHREGGLGIGLTLARQIVDRHEGNITAHSDGLGEGSEFTISLPTIHASDIQRDEASSPQSFSPIRVLVIDDNRGSQYLVPTLLGRLGSHEVRVAGSGEETLAVLTEFVPDLILLDLGLPDMSGIELARRIRDAASQAQPHIVALTGYDDEQLQNEAIEAGIDAYQIKPVSVAMLRDIFHKLGTGLTTSKEHMA